MSETVFVINDGQNMETGQPVGKKCDCTICPKQEWCPKSTVQNAEAHFAHFAPFGRTPTDYIREDSGQDSRQGVAQFRPFALRDTSQQSVSENNFAPFSLPENQEV